MKTEYKQNEIIIGVEFFKGLSEVERTYLVGFDGAKVTIDKDIDGDIMALLIRKEAK